MERKSKSLVGEYQVNNEKTYMILSPSQFNEAYRGTGILIREDHELQNANLILRSHYYDLVAKHNELAERSRKLEEKYENAKKLLNQYLELDLEMKFILDSNTEDFLNNDKEK